MKKSLTMNTLNKVLAIVLCAASFACSAGSATDAPDGKADRGDTPSLERQLQEAHVQYAASINGDVAMVQAKYQELIGNQFPEAFSANFFRFLLETNPNFANQEAALQKLDAQFFVSILFRGGGIRGTRSAELARVGNADATAAFSNSAGRVIETTGETTEEDLQVMKEASDKFSSALKSARIILLQSAAIYRLEVSATDPNSFPTPENYFGGKEIPAELKDILTQPLYAASFQEKGSAYSFFEIFFRDEDSPIIQPVRGEPREVELKLGKYQFIPASENVFKRPSE